MQVRPSEVCHPLDYQWYQERVPVQKRSKSNDHLQQFKWIRNSIVNKIRNAFFETLSQPGTTSKSLWTVIRSVNPRKSLSSGILSYGTTAVTNIQDKANLLNGYFSACFNSTFVPSTVKSSPIPSESSLDEALSYCDCTIPETEALLRNVKCGTADQMVSQPGCSVPSQKLFLHFLPF